MAENQEKKNEEIREFGQIQMKNKISLLTIIGEIEGHDCLPATTKTTKYEHVLPKLAELEDNPDTEGLLLLLNTVGGDVESGLAIAEMIASIRKPTVSLVLGGSHSIGVPLAVSTDYSFIVPSGVTCLATISIATLHRYRFVPMPAVAVTPVSFKTSRIIFSASSLALI